MTNVVFKCPRTGFNVQHRLGDETVSDDPNSLYETVACQACNAIHFINRASGKLVGETDLG